MGSGEGIATWTSEIVVGLVAPEEIAGGDVVGALESSSVVGDTSNVIAGALGGLDVVITTGSVVETGTTIVDDIVEPASDVNTGSDVAVELDELVMPTGSIVGVPCSAVVVIGSSVGVGAMTGSTYCVIVTQPELSCLRTWRGIGVVGTNPVTAVVTVHAIGGSTYTVVVAQELSWRFARKI